MDFAYSTKVRELLARLATAACAQALTLRWADGPDEVHRNQIAKHELARYQKRQ